MNEQFFYFDEAARYAKAVAQTLKIVSCVTRKGSCWVVAYDMSRVAMNDVMARRWNAIQDELYEDDVYDDVVAETEVNEELEAEIEEELEEAIENYARLMDTGWYYPDHGGGEEDNIAGWH